MSTGGVMWKDDTGNKPNWIGDPPTYPAFKPHVLPQNYEFRSYGWECPKCGAVWAPYVMKCHNCEKPAKVTCSPYSWPFPTTIKTEHNNGTRYKEGCI